MIFLFLLLLNHEIIKGTSNYHVLISGLRRLLDSSLRFSFLQLCTKIYMILWGKKRTENKDCQASYCQTLGGNSNNKIYKAEVSIKIHGQL